MSALRPAVPCAAHNRRAEPCHNFAMHGGRVCHAHGGRAPQVRAKAERRLAGVRAHVAVSRVMKRAAMRKRALTPWADELAQSAVIRQWMPATELRQIAREMTDMARLLRAEARETELRLQQGRLGS